jgi:fluoroacetyl-CoA thioesterase
MSMDEIQIGQVGEHQTLVTEALTAIAMGSGSIPVFATPAMIALMEASAVAALTLPEGQTSVGTAIDIKHIAATPLGHSVRARAEVVTVEGRQVTFMVQAWDEQELIGEGSHTRLVVDVERFMKRVNGKK